jgi:hypothetical protein
MRLMRTYVGFAYYELANKAMSQAERDLENQINEIEGSGEDSTEARGALDSERDQQSHARNS